MFGGTLWAGSMGGIEAHADREREPPARPIPLEFPDYIPPFHPKKLNGANSSSIRNRICHVRSFTEITDEDISLLNAKVTQDVDLSSLLPQDQFRSRPLLYDDDLDAMLTEISVDNQDAFREILRMDPLPGRTKPRLAYARNFFGSLEDMARYWDNSLDNYYFVPTQSGRKQKQTANTPARTVRITTSSAVAKKDNISTNVEIPDADLSNTGSDRQSSPNMKEVYKGYRFGNGEQLNPGTRVALVKNLLKMVMHKFTCRDHEPMPAPREKLIVRGVKIQSVQYHSCVARIPKDNKLARARMVEGPLLAIHCREEVRFKVTPSVSSAQELLTGGAPLERTGSDVAPSKPANAKVTSSGPGFLGERFDLFREIGCMLVLAIQREREGKNKESYSGADRWWVTEKRWGDGPLRWGQLATEVHEDDDPSWSPTERVLQEEKRVREIEDRTREKNARDSMTASTLAIDDLMAKNAPTLPPLPGDPLGGPRKKKLRSLERPSGKEEELRDGRRLMYVPSFRKKWYQEWQRLRPNTPMWDDKIIYKHIGRKGGSQFDEIYMVTSVNHHVALVRTKVHPDYLAWIENGQEVSDELVEDGLRRDVLYVQRSTWYDMFDINARRGFLIALWQLMCWLNRGYVDEAEFEKMNERGEA